MNDKIDRLADILNKLNSGEAPDVVKKEAFDLVSDISPLELSMAEQKLVENGLKAEDLRGLCEVHMQVLRNELAELRNAVQAGHMIHTLIAEHDMILSLLKNLEELNSKIQSLKNNSESTIFSELKETAENILAAENHHKREEDVLFPELESRGISGPPRIMRMEHDDLRIKKRQLLKLAENINNMEFDNFKEQVNETAKYIIFNLRDHIFKENYILYPTAIETITDDGLWQDMKKRADKIGYCPFTPNNIITVDVRNVEPKDRHPKIFLTFDKLPSGDTMELINDHDPKPLWYQFQAERNGLFEWVYVEEGPYVWRVYIKKRA